MEFYHTESDLYCMQSFKSHLVDWGETKVECRMGQNQLYSTCTNNFNEGSRGKDDGLSNLGNEYIR